MLPHSLCDVPACTIDYRRNGARVPAPACVREIPLSTREPPKPLTPDDRKRPVDPVAASILEKRFDASALAEMFARWADEDAREPEPPESWEEFKRALDAGRHSTRKLFP